MDNKQNATTTISTTASNTENPTTPAATTAPTSPRSTHNPTTTGKEKEKIESEVNKKKEDSASTEIVIRNEVIRKFSFDDLNDATEGFKIRYFAGQGGFGKVYKGLLPTKQVVAIKRLDSNSEEKAEEFKTEVETLSNASHQNIVQLIGYCNENEHKLLVYEYMKLGSLDDHLFGNLDWDARMKIAAEIAKGVEYLHVKMNPPMIYCDLKSANVLLGDGYDVKLSDFGYAKVGPEHESGVVYGSYGYCDPCYGETGTVSFESDIYSFGVVLLELISGRRAIDDTRLGDDQNVVFWASSVFKDMNKFKDIVDPLLEGKYHEGDLPKVVGIAARCVQKKVHRRPNISQIRSSSTL
ncbi:putative protein kinase RLK-Pelle-RLCK-VIIa-1 family [Medicago truncatula]|uniref:Protein kinase domain-containing protein n=1 Tax=Medicago truncatula TaxID=3880 RepID=A0A396I5E9_MEDTR|nr:putative protein kinase RLK-Pelle-RLCK-VIIa-1 family [Medicago truncatula]